MSGGANHRHFAGTFFVTIGDPPIDMRHVEAPQLKRGVWHILVCCCHNGFPSRETMPLSARVGGSFSLVPRLGHTPSAPRSLAIKFIGRWPNNNDDILASIRRTRRPSTTTRPSAAS